MASTKIHYFSIVPRKVGPTEVVIACGAKLRQNKHTTKHVTRVTERITCKRCVKVKVKAAS